jgi:cytochrome P450
MGEAVEHADLYWDPFDYALHADPHPTWRRMREEAPLYRNERHDFWALTRFQDVLDASLDWKTFSSARGDLLEIIRSGPLPAFSRSIIAIDPPEQTALRNVLSRSFTPRRIAAMEPVVRGLVRQLLDERVGSSGFDFVADFGALLPGRVISVMLGIPESDRESIRNWADDSLHRAPDEVDMRRNHRFAGELAEYIHAYIAEHRSAPRSGMIAELLEAELTDEKGRQRKLTDDEATAFIHLLAVAGNETLAKLVGWAGATLAHFSSERAKLVERPGLIPNAVEEILRYEAPSMALGRFVQRDVTLHDRVVPKGSVMVLITAATGRDPRQFLDPDRFDVERKIPRHLSFGVGPHVCLGAPLARLEARIILEEMLVRFPNWEVDWGRCEIVHTGSAVRGYSRLPICTA